MIEKDPSHVVALAKLADISSALNDQPRYVEYLERIADTHLHRGRPADALESLEKIVQVTPDNEKCLQLHREAFEAAFPGTPYKPPAPSPELRRETGPSLDSPTGAPDSSEAEGTASGPKFVEIDLLLNYGMSEKAAEMLRELAERDPSDKEVHSRLAAVYSASGDMRQAAIHTVLLAALERRADDDESSQRHLSEARHLDAGLLDDSFDLVVFAAQHGIDAIPSATHSSGAAVARNALELDLSGDLSDIFFKEGGEGPVPEDAESTPHADPATEEYSGDIPHRRKTAESLQDQIQEVDFYIRLGFADEARSKLDEIARRHPDHPDLAARYRQLESVGQGGGTEAAPQGASSGLNGSDKEEAEEIIIPLGAGAPAEDDWLESDAKPETKPTGGSVIEFPGATDPGSRHHAETPVPGRNGQVNAMFADLIDEVNALTDQEITREDFETHFNLGIAYREMALIDDAISEFQAAMKSLQPEKFNKEAIQCCGMLSTCYLEKGMPRSAIRWCQTGLNLREISSHEALALRYDMGVAHCVTGDSDRALECFGLIFSIDPSYRDVAQRIDDLRGSSGRHVP
jgi:tetratricopeptide (TPR) repeat protein